MYLLIHETHVELLYINKLGVEHEVLTIHLLLLSKTYPLLHTKQLDYMFISHA